MSERSIYNYIEAGELSICNLDLRSKVKYRKRRKKQTEIKCNKFNYRQGRTYEDFQKYMEEHPDIPVVEMDTVRGLRTKEQVLLLLHENIRNTANIYKYATQETDLGTDVITNPVEGPTPKSENIADGKKLTQRLNNLLKEYLVDEGLNTTSLAILVDDADWFMEQYPEGIAKWKFIKQPVTNDDEVRVSSVLDFKGLESDMVIYVRHEDVSQNLNYIAYTRAKYYLLELIIKK